MIRRNIQLSATQLLSYSATQLLSCPATQLLSYSAAQLPDCDRNSPDRVFRKLSGEGGALVAYWIEPADDAAE